MDAEEEKSKGKGFIKAKILKSGELYFSSSEIRIAVEHD